MKEMKPKYDFKEVENGKYDFWLKGGYFTAGDISKKPYTIVIPPPNVTGKLHLGHAWDTTLQDIIARRKRMQGYDMLYLPGSDHAGIATQAKIDAKLKEQGVSRYDIGREEFLKVSWDWVKEYRGIIHEQWGALGLSLDYTRERFTLDEGLNKAVNHVFITLYNKGLIYRGDRIINWDCEAKTALSNIEVEHKEVDGAFYYFKYPFTDGSGHVMVATTRPETMFADQAVMVHPDDERYQHLIGKEVYIAGTNVKIPVIADSYVEKDFGTGVVKVTPAHDPNDFEVGRRHNLSMPLCMDDSGHMNEMAGKYQGMDRFECRKQLVNDLKEIGLLDHIEPIKHQVGHSERTGVIVEPRLSKQWFVKMDVLSEQALKESTVKFVPERYHDTWRRWMENCNDWCISRQLWWGHRIPVWYKGEEVLVQTECPGEGWIQDEDVLDTWFSSQLWPFSSLGWPEETADFKRYFPTDTLVTGYDIIFFWVSRMIFQSIEFTKESPFKNVLIHGLIRDAQGRKMSKSLGNGVDPMDLKDKYGTDSMRYFLTTNSAPGMDLRFEEEKVLASWNYINKLWNVSRYVMMNLDEEQLGEIKVSELSIPSKWILTKLNTLIKDVDINYEKFEFGEVARSLYNFLWDDFASWYVELTKVDLQAKNEYAKSTMNVLVYVLSSVVKLLHPFIPFVTEEIYQSLPVKDSESITISAWPVVNEAYDFSDELSIMNLGCDIISAVRTIRTDLNHPMSKPITLNLEAETNVITKIALVEPYLVKFTNAKKLTISENADKDDTVSKILPDVKIFIPAKELIDKEAEIKRLEAELSKLENELTRSNKMLSNENFLAKASPEKVQAERDKLAKYQTTYANVKEHLEALKG